ncbi:MAG: hypothetical protein R2827_10545 [Bdellovibrionales bacterium]
MKKTLQAIALILAIGATVQTIKAYAQEVVSFSAEEEQHKITQLMELRKEMADKGPNFVPEESVLSSEFPEITNQEQLNEAYILHTLQYIKAISAENTFLDILKRPEVMRFIGSEPGI